MLWFLKNWMLAFIALKKLYRGVRRHKNSNLDRNAYDLEGFMWSHWSITVLISPNQLACVASVSNRVICAKVTNLATKRLLRRLPTNSHLNRLIF